MMNNLLALIEKLNVKDNHLPPEDREIQRQKEDLLDESILTKIKNIPRSKYLNLETGRFIIEASAQKKKCVDSINFICSDNEQQFERIRKKINYRSNEARKQQQQTIMPTPNKKRQVRKVINGYQPKVAKRKAITKVARHYLWIRDYGNVAESKCCCCGMNTIFESTAEAGHIVAHAKGGSSDLNNLKLICRTCNTDMGTENMYDFMRKNRYPIENHVRGGGGGGSSSSSSPYYVYRR